MSSLKLSLDNFLACLCARLKYFNFEFWEIIVSAKKFAYIRKIILCLTASPLDSLQKLGYQIY